MSDGTHPRMQSDVLREIAEVERRSLRALRAMVLGNATVSDRQRLADADVAIERLRMEMVQPLPIAEQ